MDVGKLFGSLLLSAQSWTAGIDVAIQSVDRLASAAVAAGAAVAVGLGAAVSVGLDIASGAQQAQVALEVMTKSADTANELLSELRTMAASTPFETRDLVAGAQGLMAMGFAAEETIPVLWALGDAAASSPKGMTAALPLLIRAFGQIRTKGKVSMEELNQLGENGVAAIDMLAKSMGVTTAEAMKRVASGAVDAGTGLAALMEGIQNQSGGMMARQSKTLQGVLSTLRDDVGNTLGDLAAPLRDALTAAIPEISGVGKTMLTGLEPVFRLMAEGVRVVGGLVAAFSTLPAPVQQFSALAVVGAGAAAGALGAVTLAALAIVPAVLAAAAAVSTLDMAMLPIVAAIGAVGAAAALMGATTTAAIVAVAAEWAALYSIWQNDVGGVRSLFSALWLVVEAGIGILGAIQKAWGGLATYWLRQLGLMQTQTSGAAKGMGEALMEAIQTAVSAGAGLLERLRVAVVDMAIGAVAALQKMVAVLAMIPGLESKAAEAQGKLLQATIDLAAARGKQIDLSGVNIDISGTLKGLLPEAATEAWDKFMAGTRGATAQLVDYSGALDHLLGQGESAAKGGKETKEEKALRVALERMAEDLQRADRAITEGGGAFRSTLAGIGVEMQTALWKEANNIGSAIGAGAAQAAEDIRAAARAKFLSVVEGIGGIFVEAAGNLGQTIQAAVQGASTGGAAGAAVAAIGSMLSQNAAFQNLIASLNTQFSAIVTALNPLVQGIGMILVPVMQLVAVLVGALVPVFRIVGQVFGMLAPALAMLGGVLQAVAMIISVAVSILEPVMPLLELAFRALFNIFKVVALIVMGIALALGAAWNGILEVIARVISGLSNALGGIEALDKMAASLRDQKVDTEGMVDAMAELAATTYDQAYASALAGAQTAMLGDAAAEAAASLMNVPTGYKVALTRFQQMSPESAGNAAMQRSGNGSGATTYIASLTITAVDPSQIIAEIDRRTAQQAWRLTGVSLAQQTPRWAGSGGGGGA